MQQLSTFNFCFPGLLRANDENLPAHETVPSTETFVAFQGQVSGSSWELSEHVETACNLAKNLNLFCIFETNSTFSPPRNPISPQPARFPAAVARGHLRRDQLLHRSHHEPLGPLHRHLPAAHNLQSCTRRGGGAGNCPVFFASQRPPRSAREDPPFLLHFNCGVHAKLNSHLQTRTAIGPSYGHPAASSGALRAAQLPCICNCWTQSLLASA